MCPPNQNPQNRLSTVLDRIHSACERAGRESDEVRLLAVSKTKPLEQVLTMAKLGQRAFGENYVDEAVAKIQASADHDLGGDLVWHFIGPIQSNKTRLIAEHFDWVESVDRAKIVRRLADQRPSTRPPLNVLIQVNLDGESQKAGCTPEALNELADQITQRPELCLRGLMAIPAPRSDEDEQRAVFARLKSLFDALRSRYDGIDTLSAGMSGDLEAAIAEGSTQIRVGTDLFGPRG
ncbi:MAG: YggS family pyridoxal phosphate-dependent enzyme [Pseudomonadota bacterium]